MMVFVKSETALQFIMLMNAFRKLLDSVVMNKDVVDDIQGVFIGRMCVEKVLAHLSRMHVLTRISHAGGACRLRSVIQYIIYMFRA